MKITIATIMAVYRGDDPLLLAVALDSILNQEFTDDVESRLYLAVDGPVPLNIRREIEYREKSIYFIHFINRNVGLAAALNLLIDHLNEETLIFRMDADDRSHNNRYQLQINYLHNNPTIDILGTDIIEVDVLNNKRRRVSFCLNPQDALDRLCRGVPVAHPTVCFKRHVLKSVGGYPLTGTNEDISLWFRCAKEGFKFDNVHEPLLDFTVGTNFWHRRSISKAVSELKCYFIGIWTMNGITWKYIYPLMRFVLRISPLWFTQLIYRSSIRRSSSVE